MFTCHCGEVYLNTTEAADRLGVDASQVRRWAERGQLNGQAVVATGSGQVWLFLETEVSSFTAPHAERGEKPGRKAMSRKMQIRSGEKDVFTRAREQWGNKVRVDVSHRGYEEHPEPGELCVGSVFVRAGDIYLVYLPTDTEN